MKDVNLVILWFLTIFLLSLITIFLGAWLVRKDVKKRTRWATYNSLFFSFVFILSLVSIIVIGLISIKEDFNVTFPFIIFGIVYLYLFLKGRSKYKEKFE